MKMALKIVFGILLATLAAKECHAAPTANVSGNRSRDRQRRFGPMGGGPGGMSPFHGPGGMGGMNPMQGPRAPGMGGMGHGAASMFSGSGFSCIRGDLVCPQWCLVIDGNGCKSCPCGPAGGMNAIAGGPSGNPMGMAMSAMGGGGGGMMGGGASGSSGPTGNVFMSGHGSTGGHSTNECIGTKLCIQGCSGQYELGPVGADGCQSCTCKAGSSSSSSVTIVGQHTTGHCTECTETKPVTNTQIVYVKPEVTYVKPVKQCTATLLCASTCESGYQLGSTDSGGCRSCTCPSKHQISTTTIHYVTQVVAPATKECTHTAHCMSTCDSGYHMSTTDTHGCPVCNCMQVEKPYQYPIEIAVEPPPQQTYEKPYHYPIEIAVEPPPEKKPQYTITLSLTCSSALTCSTACSVGYKCGDDKCPTCECIHPAVVGMTTIEHIHVERPVICSTALQCPDSCNLGYKCGPDGCPTCECLVAVTTSYQQVRPQYTLQTCTHTLTCAATCTHGYELVTDGSGGCQKCVCKEQTVYGSNQIYAIQRPQPQYAIVDCPSTDSCASQCPYGHEIVRPDGRCPECRCVQRPSSSGSQMFVLSSGGSSGMGHVGGSGGLSYNAPYSAGGSDYCPPITPDCHPSCIKYDDPHCRRCICEIHYPQYQGLLRGK